MTTLATFPFQLHLETSATVRSWSLRPMCRQYEAGWNHLCSWSFEPTNSGKWKSVSKTHEFSWKPWKAYLGTGPGSALMHIMTTQAWVNQKVWRHLICIINIACLRDGISRARQLRNFTSGNKVGEHRTGCIQENAFPGKIICIAVSRTLSPASNILLSPACIAGLPSKRTGLSSFAR